MGALFWNRESVNIDRAGMDNNRAGTRPAPTVVPLGDVVGIFQSILIIVCSKTSDLLTPQISPDKFRFTITDSTVEMLNDRVELPGLEGQK